MKRRLIAFDLDGTLAVTKSPISDLMATRLKDLLAMYDVCVISGGKFDQFRVQLIEWWAPFTKGIGPAGAYVAGLDPNRRDDLRERCRTLLPEPPFTLSATAWAARGARPESR